MAELLDRQPPEVQRMLLRGGSPGTARSPRPRGLPGAGPGTRVTDLNQLRLDQADVHLDVARAYAATTTPDRQYRLRMALAALDLMSARLRGDLGGVFQQAGERHLLKGAALARDIGRPYLEVACLARLGFAAVGHSFPRPGGTAKSHSAGGPARLGRRTADRSRAGHARRDLVWTGEFDHGGQWLDQARRATQAGASQASSCSST